MDITDKELRKRLKSFNVVVPVTNSTRKLLLKKLEKLENNQVNTNVTSNSMPPPKPKAPNNGTNDSIMISSYDTGKQSQHMTFDTMDSPSKSTRRRKLYRAPDSSEASDSEIESGSLGRSIMPANPLITSSSPKSNEKSLMNVSNWKNALDLTEDPYMSSPNLKKSPKRPSKTLTEKIIPTVDKTPTIPVLRNLRSSPAVEPQPQSHADQAIQRWKEKVKSQSLDKIDLPDTTFKNSSQSSRRNIQILQQSRKGSQYIRNAQYIYFLPLIVVFFVAIFGLYFTSIQSSTVVLPSGILKSLCAKKNLQGSYCNTEQEKVQRLYNSLVSRVQDKYIKNQCEKLDIEPTVDAKNLFEYFSTHENIPLREIEELIELFKSIAKTYSDSPIGFDNSSFNISVQPNLPIVCAVKLIFSNMINLILWIGIVALSIVGLYFVICYITTKSEQHKQEVNQLIENTINLLKVQAQDYPDESYLPLIHIRDCLIPVKERQAKTKIWTEVVQYFTESDANVRSEVEEINGEDFQVWRWVQPMSHGV